MRFPDGTLGTYIRDVAAVSAPGQAVLPVVGGRIVLVEHFRHAVRGWSLEIPRGFGEAGFSAEESARVVCLTPLGSLHVDAGMSADPVSLFHAEIDGVGAFDAAEGIGAVRLAAPAELAELISSGAVTDGYTMAAYLRASLRGLL
ncbi:NUDIX hydrolase [Phytomonospora sp. NPDC050363]|uniref:NUDIX hydrolase n=1 Tax=Phytomonospora sp. NPDC050363 TaxID=3155642 RepID=UPI0033C393EB